MVPDSRDWMVIGRTCWPAPAPLQACLTGPLALARAAWPRQVQRRRWIRYRIELADTPSAPPSRQLVRITDTWIGALRSRAECAAEPELKSGLRLWDRGVRQAYAWMDRGRLLAIQWLVTPEDHARLRQRGDGVRYLPLAPDWGEITHLYVFVAAQFGQIAGAFQRALFAELWAVGLRGLTTHIEPEQRGMRDILEATGWRRDGTLTHYRLGSARGLAASVYLHRSEARSSGEGARLDEHLRPRPWDTPPATVVPTPATWRDLAEQASPEDRLEPGEREPCSVARLNDV
jgi:hypothetical protein